MHRVRYALTALCLSAGPLLPGCAPAPEAPPPEPGATAQPAAPDWDLPPRGELEDGPAPPMPDALRRAEVPEVRVETVASGLTIPWDLAFAGEGRVLVTERPGRVRLIENGQLRAEPYASIPVLHAGEGGLMGIAVPPDYETSRHVYLMYTYRGSARTVNRVARYRDTGQGLAQDRLIFDGIPAARIHNGGALRFGPDGMLYVSTGDAGEPDLAQDLASLAGKILRLDPDGGIPADNPFPGSPVYVLGLRNSQGFAWHPQTGELWITEHGPTGDLGLRHRDAVYAVRAGANCGWPRVLGVTRRPGIESPVLYYPERAVPPAAALFYTGDLLPGLRGNFFFATLRSQHLQRVVVRGDREVAQLERWWEEAPDRGRYGRLRGLAQAPDGSLWFTTSNRDGRGRPREGDDRVLRIVPAG